MSSLFSKIVSAFKSAPNSNSQSGQAPSQNAPKDASPKVDVVPSNAPNDEPEIDELDQYDYELPERLVAQTPLANRANARMMVVDRQKQTFEHRRVSNIVEYLRPEDALVLNDTKVIPARLIGRRASTGGR